MTFTSFPDLPAELRHMIYRFALDDEASTELREAQPERSNTVTHDKTGVTYENSLGRHEDVPYIFKKCNIKFSCRQVVSLPHTFPQPICAVIRKLTVSAPRADLHVDLRSSTNSPIALIFAEPEQSMFDRSIKVLSQVDALKHLELEFTLDMHSVIWRTVREGNLRQIAEHTPLKAIRLVFDPNVIPKELQRLYKKLQAVITDILEQKGDEKHSKKYLGLLLLGFSE